MLYIHRNLGLLMSLRATKAFFSHLYFLVTHWNNHTCTWLLTL